MSTLLMGVLVQGYYAANRVVVKNPSYLLTLVWNTMMTEPSGHLAAEEGYIYVFDNTICKLKSHEDQVHRRF